MSGILSRRGGGVLSFVFLALLCLAFGAGGCSTGEGLVSAELSMPPAARERVTLAAAKGAVPPPIVAGAAIPGAEGAARETASVAATEDFDVVTVMWGTNRESEANVAGETSAAVPPKPPKFTSKRSSRLTTGYAKITVPKKNRAVGEIPLAGGEYTVLNVTLYNDKENPREHFTIGELATLTRDEFRARANYLDARARNYRDHAFIFVHGYWNTFEDGLYRTAQLSYDMGFDGVPYSFSWPSKGALTGYLYDRDSVDASQHQFVEFLDLVSKTTQAKKIHIIAHSMGARLVVDTLFPSVGPSRLAQFPKIDQIVLAAADVDNSVMKARAAAISGSVKAVTLYASDKDEALLASKTLAGSAPRAGEVRDGRPFIMAGVETIDISSASTLVFIGKNHNKFATNAHILKDIALLMKGGIHPPDVRFPVFASAADDDGTYWRYVKQ